MNCSCPNYTNLNVAQTTPLWCQKRSARKMKKCHHWWEWPMMSTRPGKNLKKCLFERCYDSMFVGIRIIS